MNIVEERLCDLDARGSEEADNLTNERNLDRFILTGNTMYVKLFCNLRINESSFCRSVLHVLFSVLISLFSCCLI